MSTTRGHLWNWRPGGPGPERACLLDLRPGHLAPAAIEIDPTTYMVLTVAGFAMGMLLFLTASG
jgi:hypothetical protein